MMRIGRRLPPFPPGRQVDLGVRGTGYVRELGDPAAPPLLLLHGWAGSGALHWGGLLLRLATEHRVLVPDLRGHGRGNRAAPWSPADDAADMAVLLGALKLSGPAVVVGYSSGGAVAAELARSDESLVAGIVLCATTATFPSPLTLALTLRAAERGLSQLPRGWLAGAVPAPTLTRRAGLRGLDEMLRSDLHTVVASGRALERYDMGTWIGDLDVPTVVLATTRDRDAPLVDQRRMAELIPGARLRTVDGDHRVMVEHPTRLLAALRPAIEDVAGRGGVRDRGSRLSL